MMISNTTGIRPSQFHFTLLPLLLGHAPFSRQILLSQRPGFTTRASLFCHHQNPKTFPASFPQKIITSIQERKSSTNPAATPVAVKDEVVLSRKEKKKENKALRLNFIKKVYIYLGLSSGSLVLFTRYLRSQATPQIQRYHSAPVAPQLSCLLLGFVCNC